MMAVRDIKFVLIARTKYQVLSKLPETVKEYNIANHVIRDGHRTGLLGHDAVPGRLPEENNLITSLPSADKEKKIYTVRRHNGSL